MFAIHGEAKQILLEMEDDVLYREANFATGQVSGMTEALAKLDARFRGDSEERAEDSMNRFERCRRLQGMSMRQYKTQFEARWTKARSRANASMSDNVLSMRFLNGANMKKDQIATVLSRVDGD